MADYRELISVKDFLDVQRRASQLGGVTLADVQFGYSTLSNSEEFTLEFSVVGITDTYQQFVQVLDVSVDDVMELRASELIRQVRTSDLRVYCDCPAFLYWGFSYISWNEDYGIEPQSIFPTIRNPDLDGKICKHLYAVLQAYPFQADRIAREMREYVSTFLQLSRFIPSITTDSLSSQLTKSIHNNISTLLSS